MLIGKYEMIWMDKDPRVGDDIIVKCGTEVLRTFNSLSNDYAHTAATEFIRELQADDKRKEEKENDN